MKKFARSVAATALMTAAVALAGLGAATDAHAQMGPFSDNAVCHGHPRVHCVPNRR